MKRAASAVSRRSPAEIRLAIESFLQSSKRPVLLEPGTAEIPFGAGRYEIDLQGERLLLSAWSDAARVSRRVVDIQRSERGRLELVTQLFGNRPGILTLYDADRPQQQHVRRRGGALQFREQFRRFLARQFPGWDVAGVSVEPDLEHTLSPRYPRASIRQGVDSWAAIGSEADDAADVLTFGLIWLDYLAQRDPKRHWRGLVLLLPDGAETTTRERLAWMDPQRAAYHLFVYSPEGFESEVDIADRGNLQSDLPDVSLLAGANGLAGDAWLRTIRGLPEVETVAEKPGECSLRVRGLEFAHQKGETVRFGVETKQVATASHLAEIEGIARRLGGWRAPGAATYHPLYQRAPERWLESTVRRYWDRLDATLLPEPVYGQVPAFAAQDRGLLDLLAVDCAGRLAVIELKATVDPHLPMQALDYWMRVWWHAQRGHFAARGYFPGTAVDQQELPRLLLVAPALQFHSTTETILRYWSPAIPVERFGVGSQWRSEITVLFRLWGDQRPQ